MTLLKRIGYYLGGFSLGLIILAFFLNGKNVSCDYGPEARVKKKILNKPISFNEQEADQFAIFDIDSTSVIDFIETGNIVFSESEPRKEPCGVYNIENTLGITKLGLQVENCTDNVVILKISKLN